jgi:hypothetical protein
MLSINKFCLENTQIFEPKLGVSHKVLLCYITFQKNLLDQSDHVGIWTVQLSHIFELTHNIYEVHTSLNLSCIYLEHKLA